MDNNVLYCAAIYRESIVFYHLKAISAHFRLSYWKTLTRLSNLWPFGKSVSVQRLLSSHYDDVIMTMLASQITSLPVVCSIVYSDVNQRKHQSSASLAFVREIHRGPVNFPHKWPVTRKMFPFDDVIMLSKGFPGNLKIKHEFVKRNLHIFPGTPGSYGRHDKYAECSTWLIKHLFHNYLNTCFVVDRTNDSSDLHIWMDSTHVLAILVNTFSCH